MKLVREPHVGVDFDASMREKPWVCDHCERRYKTERGANQHERRCYSNPHADQLHLNAANRMRESR